MASHPVTTIPVPPDVGVVILDADDKHCHARMTYITAGAIAGNGPRALRWLVRDLISNEWRESGQKGVPDPILKPGESAEFTGVFDEHLAHGRKYAVIVQALPGETNLANNVAM